MDPGVIAACRGAYVLRARPTTERQRRLLRSVWAVGALALVAFVGLRGVQFGWTSALELASVLASYAVAGVVVARLGTRHFDPVTRVDDDGLVARTAWREGRTLAWGDVVAIEPPGGFHAFPVAVATDGSRQELPGLPVEVAQRLDDALLAARGEDRRPRPRSTEVRPLTDDGWDGPFCRSGPVG